MGMLKGFRYPELEPDEVAKILKQIVNAIGASAAPQEAIAAAVKFSPKSSSFRIKIADLIQYGLLEGRGSLKATDLAQRLATGDKTVYKDIMENIPLLKSLYNNLAGQEAPQDITPYLMTITKCDRIDAEKKKERIRNLYNSFLQKIREGENMPTSTMPRPISQGIEKLRPQPSGDKITLIIPSGDSLSLEETSSDIDLLISKLQNMKKNLEKKK